MIVLNKKDADFILKFIRMDLRRLNEQEERLKESENRFDESYEKVGGDESLLGKCLMDLKNEIGKQVKNDFVELKEDFNRCIELLTIGSEATQ